MTSLNFQFFLNFNRVAQRLKRKTCNKVNIYCAFSLFVFLCIHSISSFGVPVNQEVESVVTKGIEKSIFIFPNPVKNYIYVRWNSELPAIQIDVLDIDGQLISSKSIVNQPVYIPTDDLAVGVYFICLPLKTGGSIIKRFEKNE